MSKPRSDQANSVAVSQSLPRKEADASARTEKSRRQPTLSLYLSSGSVDIFHGWFSTRVAGLCFATHTNESKNTD